MKKNQTRRDGGKHEKSLKRKLEEIKHKRETGGGLCSEGNQLQPMIYWLVHASKVLSL